MRAQFDALPEHMRVWREVVLCHTDGTRYGMDPFRGSRRIFELLPGWECTPGPPWRIFCRGTEEAIRSQEAVERGIARER